MYASCFRTLGLEFNLRRADTMEVSDSRDVPGMLINKRKLVESRQNSAPYCPLQRGRNTIIHTWFHTRSPSPIFKPVNFSKKWSIVPPCFTLPITCWHLQSPQLYPTYCFLSKPAHTTNSTPKLAGFLLPKKAGSKCTITRCSTYFTKDRRYNQREKMPRSEWGRIK